MDTYNRKNKQENVHKLQTFSSVNDSQYTVLGKLPNLHFWHHKHDFAQLAYYIYFSTS